MQNKIKDLMIKAVKEGASEATINELVDTVGKMATEMAVNATSKLYVEKIKEAAEAGKAEFEAKQKGE